MCSRTRLIGGLTLLGAVVVLENGLHAQEGYGPRPGNPYGYQRPAPQPGYMPHRLAERTSPVQASLPSSTPAQPAEHPLVPAIRWAHEGLANIEKIRDYTATVVKRERIGGTLGEHEYMFVKVRHKPFSVYLHYLGPPDKRGQEVIYIDGQNNGKMWAHGTGMQKTMFGTISLAPDGMIAMRGQLYPVTELGILNLVRRLIEVGEEDMKYGECDVRFIEGAKINGRQCTCIEVMHPVPRRNFLFHRARIFVDEELNVPIRYAAYDWPKQPGEQPPVMEEYTYLDLKLNVGLTPADFDTRNPNYQF